MDAHLKLDSQNNDELAGHKAVVLKFFRDCKIHGLLTDTNCNLEKKRKARTRIDVSETTCKALEKIRCYRNEQKDNSQKVLLSDKTHDALQFSFHINFVRESIEEIKILLPLVFDPCKTYLQGSLEKNLDMICFKLKYGQKQKCRINKAFQVDLRHALTHQNYWFDIKEDHIKNMMWRDSNRVYRWTPHDLLKSNAKACFIIEQLI